ncbi:hypothetical protein [Saliphagus sp. LR7]|uniref:hypothetical protein n=1 Tax=Saliphagus sp. LR7 TaxID=2282654 RepID=UPI000DF76124|nr:hypothetical protein [Saliphagus sp. LR7]
MALTTYIPGMAPGRTPRNLVVLVVYLICFPVVPFVLAYAAFSNYNQISDRLAMRNTPGFTPGGGAKPAAVTLIVLLVTISLIASLGAAPFLVLADSGSGSQPSTQASADDEQDSGADNPTADEGGGDEERGEEAGEGEEQMGNTADSDDGFGGESLMDGESFIDGGASASDNLSDEERAANTQALFEDMLTEAGYEITDGEMDDGVIHIEYRTYAEDRDEALAEIVEIAGGYVALEGTLLNEFAEEDQYEGVFKEQTEGLHVTILDPNDVEQGTFSIESEWARAFANEEISEEEYLDRIEETIEIPDHFENSGEFGDSGRDNNSSG